MNSQKSNREIMIRFFNTISGKRKTPALLGEFLIDEKLIQHFMFFDGAFPESEFLLDEITAENNRVVVRARAKGRHHGELNGIPPTGKEVEVHFSMGTQIENEKIISHWMISDQMSLLEQLGVTGHHV